jgi:phage-related tail protein
MLTRICSDCKKKLPLKKFYRNRRRCKICQKEINVAYYIANSDKRKVNATTWQKANPDRVKANSAAWKKANPKKTKIYQQRKNITGAHRAMSAVYEAIQCGNLPNLKKSFILCSNCRLVRAVNYDHRDYNFPLAVTPVCLRCNNLLGAAIPITEVKI